MVLFLRKTIFCQKWHHGATCVGGVPYDTILCMADDLASRIKECRKQLKLTQGELAKKLGVSLKQVWKWESGRDQPSSIRMPDLAKVFDVGIEWLLTGKRKVAYLDLNTPLTSQHPTAPEFVERRVKFNVMRLVALPEFAELKVIEQKASADFNPVFAQPIQTVWVDKKLATQDHYGVVIKGQSMSPTICEGDVAIVFKKGWHLEEYDSDRGAALKHEWKKLHRSIVICSINDDEPLCKRLFVTDLPNSDMGFFIQLGSDNSEAPPVAVWRKDRLVVYGVVVAMVRDLVVRGNGNGEG